MKNKCEPWSTSATPSSAGAGTNCRKEEKRSRAALIREAIDDFLAKRRSKHEGDAFGLWGKRKVDGLAYQEKAARRMVKALFDTNILVDYLNAVPEARIGTSSATRDKAISIITWMEVMVGADRDLEAPTRSFLNSFDVVPVDERIAERAVGLRRSHRIKSPDAVIWATAQARTRALLVTRNTKHFPHDDPGIRAPYRL